MINTPQMELERAIELAVRWHTGQRDKGFEPYILHPLAVMLSLPLEDHAGRIVAVLHDVVEDTPCSLMDLLACGISDAHVHAVDAISKRPRETNIEYWRRSKANPIALRVKLADMAHNCSLDRLRRLSYGEQTYLTKKYKEMREFFGA